MPNRAAFPERFHADRRGAVSIMGALLLLLGMAVSVMVIDAGHAYLARRRLQAAVDAAALAAAGDPANAQAIAAGILGTDGYADTRRGIETGVYTADPALAPASRFTAGGDAANAVRVTQTIAVPGYFTAVFHGGATDVTATATATQSPIVSFSAGSDLAALDDGLVNAVLGGLLGVKLDAVGYQGLAAANVDALGFLDRLATAADVTAGTYGDLADATVTVGQVIAAAEAELNLQPGATANAALRVLQTLSVEVPPTVSATLGSVVDTALWQDRRIGSIAGLGDGGATVNLFDVLTALARVYGAGHLVDAGTGLALPGGDGVTVKLAVGEAMQSATGPVGTGIDTAQVRLAIDATLAGVNLNLAGLPLLSLNIALPLYLEIASGKATVSAVPCMPGGTRATITAAPQAVTLEAGRVDADAMQDFGAPVTAAPSPTISISAAGITVATVQEAGSLTLAAGAPVPLDFTQGQIDAGTAQTAAGSDAGALFSAFRGALVPSVAVLPDTGLTLLLNAVLSSLTAAVQSSVSSLLVSLDPVIDTLLGTLGLRLGAMDVVVHGVRCGRPVLVR